MNDAHESAGSRLPDRHTRAVIRVIHAMAERMEQPFTLEKMARMVGMSRFHFNRTFRRVTGVPPRHFLGALRLEAARRLLLTTPASVTDVCLSVGYSSLGTFVRRFTLRLGLSPRQLRVLASDARGAPSGRAQSTTVGTSHQVVAGTLEAPPNFIGLVLVGVFRSPLPQDVPLACAILCGSAPYAMTVDPGTYYLFALAIPAGALASDYLLSDAALRAGGQQIDVTASGVTGDTDLRLRRGTPTDPPILLALPALARRMVGERVGRGAAARPGGGA